MPDPSNDKDQLRFAQIRGRMIDSLAKNLPEFFVTSSGAETREDFREKLCQSDMVVSIIEVCAYEAQRMEEEKAHGRRP